MRLGDLLLQARLVTKEAIAEALARQATNGSRLGDNLLAIGAIDSQTLENFLKRIPPEPANLESTGIEAVDLLAILMKLIYHGRLEVCRQFVDAIKLPYPLVADLIRMAIDRKLLHVRGMGVSDSPIDMMYGLTEEGKRWSMDALDRQRYVGPAPVTLDEFNYQVNMQKLTNERVTFEGIRRALGDFVFEDSIIEQFGPALNSGRAILLYGPPGNGKTSFAFALKSVFNDVIHVPYAIYVEGQIIRFYDPRIHREVTTGEQAVEESLCVVRAEEVDARWIACRRPFVVTGGELTLEMLDLRYNPNGHSYEAPLHVKALGGCFILDDFGRQLVPPKHLLNRWIVPLENRIDFLKLHTGKSFCIPFEELVVFSTNLEPEDLMDPAFLRRLPYKIEVGAPTPAIYRKIFERECARHGLPLSDETFEFIVHNLRKEKSLDFAAYQPKFTVDQVVATCRFMGQPPHFEPRFIRYALNNLKVKRKALTVSDSVAAPVVNSNAA